MSRKEPKPYAPIKGVQQFKTHASLGAQSEITTFDLTVLDFPPPPIDFKGKRFVFTGNLIYGNRSKCAEETRKLGALVDSGLTLKTDYLVVGVQADDKWKHGSKGGKIVKAMDYRERPECNLKIVSGIAWATWLRAHQSGRVSPSMMERTLRIFELLAEDWSTISFGMD